MSGIAPTIRPIEAVPTSATVASVPMSVPGSLASQATVLDNFPLAKKRRAVPTASASSLLRGVLGDTILTVFILIARWYWSTGCPRC